jgi:Tfp pilus assembly protein PilN
VRPVNLIPREHRRAAVGQGKRPGSAYAVVGLLAVLLVMAVAYVTVSNQIKTRTADADAAAAQADQLEAQAQQLGSFSDFAAIQQQRLASVATVATTRFDWERFLRELSRIMPAGSWLQSSDASTSMGEDAAAATTTPTAGTGVPVGPNAKLVGCTPNQSDVARMMVRMRRMYRVTDVQLNESVQEASGTPATVDNCGKFYKFDITLSFEAAAAAKEAPRGTNEVPASLGGGS